MCRATATGMAAVFASIACHVRAGERVVASRALFGSCHFILDQILPRWGIETVFVEGTNLDEWEAALSQPTKAVFLESPSNPMLDLVDIAAVAEMTHAAGALMVVGQRLCNAAVSETFGAGGRHCSLFGNEAYRWPWSLPWRGGARHRRIHDRAFYPVLPSYRPFPEPVQRLGHGQVPRNSVAAGRPSVSGITGNRRVL